MRLGNSRIRVALAAALGMGMAGCIEEPDTSSTTPTPKPDLRGSYQLAGAMLTGTFRQMYTDGGSPDGPNGGQVLSFRCGSTSLATVWDLDSGTFSSGSSWNGGHTGGGSSGSGTLKDLDGPLDSLSCSKHEGGSTSQGSNQWSSEGFKLSGIPRTSPVGDGSGPVVFEHWGRAEPFVVSGGSRFYLSQPEAPEPFPKRIDQIFELNKTQPVLVRVVFEPLPTPTPSP